jgi:hypothetical protein
MKTHGFKLIKDTVEAVSGDQLYINEFLRDPRWLNKITDLRKYF